MLPSMPSPRTPLRSFTSLRTKPPKSFKASSKICLGMPSHMRSVGSLNSFAQLKLKVSKRNGSTGYIGKKIIAEFMFH